MRLNNIILHILFTLFASSMLLACHAMTGTVQEFKSQSTSTNKPSLHTGSGYEQNNGVLR